MLPFVLFLIIAQFVLVTAIDGEGDFHVPRHVLRIPNVSAVAIPALHADEWQEPYKIVPIDFDNDGDTEQLVGFKKLIRVIDFRANPPKILARDYINPVDDQTVYNQDSGDLDGDGFPDIVAASGKDFVAVILNDQGKGFRDRKDYFAGGETRGTKLADVDSDGNLDLLYTTQDDGYLNVRLGNGDGTFRESAMYDASPKPYSIAPKDIDLDGDIDVVIPNESTNSITLLFNRGDGTFEEKVQMETTGQRANHVAIDDFNNDTLPDLLVANWHNPNNHDLETQNKNSISLFFNIGSGMFGAPVALDGLRGSCWIKTADLDNDGDADFVVSNWLSDATSVYLNDGNGRFDIQPYYTGAGNYGLLLSDFNGDGLKDILTTNIMEETFSLLLSGEDGVFDEHRKFYPAWQ
ncbi:MAG TPA: VCBS repeat-containing protein [Candidatus Peribacterales bacterium]|nr:VCBS repeat-containing protein [Candidatus Peribacterales bacterium]